MYLSIDSFENYSYKGSYAQRPTEEVWEVVTAIHTYIYNKTTIREALENRKIFWLYCGLWVYQIT